MASGAKHSWTRQHGVEPRELRRNPHEPSRSLERRNPPRRRHFCFSSSSESGSPHSTPASRIRPVSPGSVSTLDGFLALLVVGASITVGGAMTVLVGLLDETQKERRASVRPDLPSKH